MLQEDRDEITGPRPERSEMEGGHPENVGIVNRDAGGEQDVKQFDVVLWVTAIEAYTSDIPKHYQSRIRVAQRLQLPCEVGSVARGGQQLGYNLLSSLLDVLRKMWYLTAKASLSAPAKHMHPNMSRLLDTSPSSPTTKICYHATGEGNQGTVLIKSRSSVASSPAMNPDLARICFARAGMSCATDMLWLASLQLINGRMEDTVRDRKSPTAMYVTVRYRN